MFFTLVKLNFNISKVYLFNIPGSGNVCFNIKKDRNRFRNRLMF